MNLRLLALWDPATTTYGEYKKWLIDSLTHRIEDDR